MLLIAAVIAIAGCGYDDKGETADLARQAYDANLQRCRDWAAEELPPVLHSAFEGLTPTRMDDLQRTFWREIMMQSASGSGSEVELWCAPYFYAALPSRE